MEAGLKIFGKMAIIPILSIIEERNRQRLFSYVIRLITVGLV